MRVGYGCHDPRQKNIERAITPQGRLSLIEARCVAREHQARVEDGGGGGGGGGGEECI